MCADNDVEAMLEQLHSAQKVSSHSKRQKMYNSLSAVILRHEYNISGWMAGQTGVPQTAQKVKPGAGTGFPAARLTCFCSSFCDAGGLFEEVRHRGLADLQVVGPVGLRRHEKQRTPQMRAPQQETPLSTLQRRAAVRSFPLSPPDTFLCP